MFSMIWMEGWNSEAQVLNDGETEQPQVCQETNLATMYRVLNRRNGNCHSNGLYTTTRPLVSSTQGCFGGLAKMYALLSKLLETVTNDTHTYRCGTDGGQHSYVIIRRFHVQTYAWRPIIRELSVIFLTRSS
jgi:hypothetical protein